MRNYATQALVGLLTVALMGMMTPAFAGIIVTVGKTGPATTDNTDGPEHSGLTPALDGEPSATEPVPDPKPARPGAAGFDNAPFEADEAYPSDEEAAGMDCQPIGGGIMWCRNDVRPTGASAGAAGGGSLSDGDMVDVDGSGDLEALGCSGGGSQAPLALLLGMLGFLGLRVRTRRTR